MLYISSPPLTVAIPALLINLFSRIPFVFEVRDCWPEAPVQMGALKNPLLIRLLRAFERLIYFRAEHVVALSPDMRDVIEKTGADVSKIAVVPNCADLDLFFPQVETTEVIRKRLNLQDKFACLYFGAMGEANGLNAILDSAELLKRREDERVAFVFCGDGKERLDLEARVSAQKLSNVTFIGPFSNKGEVAQIVASVDVCITHYKNVPILYTCSPNKLFDALSAGKPVIVNTPGWTKELLEENQAGFYAAPDNPAELANLLQSLSEDPERIKTYGANARALAEAKFDRRVHARKLLKIFKLYAGTG